MNDQTTALEVIPPSKMSKVSMTSFGSGGALPALESLSDVVTIATLMSRSGQAVPKHLRDSEGACFAVTLQALEWGASPFAVANKSYMVNDRIAYEAQMVSAIINARAPIKGRPVYTYEGDGPTRQCTVTVTTDAEEPQTLAYTSPMFKDIAVKNSPLWKSDPDQQFAYFSIRSLARRYFPEIVLGIIDREEAAEIEETQTGGAASGLRGRLESGGAAAGGFDPKAVGDMTAPKADDAVDAEFEEKPAVEPEPDPAERQATREGEPTEGEVYILAAEVEAGGKVQTYKDGEKYSKIGVKGQGKYAVYAAHPAKAAAPEPEAEEELETEILTDSPQPGAGEDMLRAGEMAAGVIHEPGTNGTVDDEPEGDVRDQLNKPLPAEEPAAAAPPADPQTAKEPQISTGEERVEPEPLTPLGRMKLATTWARATPDDEPGVLDIYGEIAKSDAFKGADPEDQDEIRAEAWVEVQRIIRDHGAKVDQALDLSAFALWFVTQTGQDGIDAIEGTYRTVKRTPRYEKQSDAFKASLDNRVKAYIARITAA